MEFSKNNKVLMLFDSIFAFATLLSILQKKLSCGFEKGKDETGRFIHLRFMPRLARCGSHRLNQFIMKNEKKNLIKKYKLKLPTKITIAAAN